MSAPSGKTSPVMFVRDFLWARRYAHRFVTHEGPLRHAWHYARRIAPRNRRKDRLKYG